MSSRARSWLGFFAGFLIGSLGGLIGLGGAEFRLPVLIGLFHLPTLEAIILNKAVSLIVVAASLIFRAEAIPFDQLLPYPYVAVNLLAGTLIGAWWSAGHAIRMSRQLLNRIIVVLLIGLALLMLTEAIFGFYNEVTPLIDAGPLRFIVGLTAGLGIGMVAALLGVAGGELLIPTIVILYGIDIKLAGSLSLMVSLPTIIVGFARYSSSNAFTVLRQERLLSLWMVGGSILGASLGGQLVGIVSPRVLISVLGVILLISAIKTFKHRN